MKNLLYLLLIIVFAACSKKETEKENPKESSVEGYIRVTTFFRLNSFTYAKGEKAKVFLEVYFDRQTDQKAAEIVKIDASDQNGKFYEGSVDLKSNQFNSTLILETTPLNPGKNTFYYTLTYADGYRQKGSINVFALKDKTLDTWWDEMTFQHLDTIKTRYGTVHATKNINDVVTYTQSNYGAKLPHLVEIEGIYGTITAYFDATEQLQLLTVVNADRRYDPTASLDIVKNDILAAFPDCQVTSAFVGESYLLTSSRYTFHIRQNLNLTTEIERRK